MRTKRTLAAMLALSVGMSMTACGGKQAEATKTTEKEQLAGDLNNDGQIEMGQDGVEVEVNVSDVHMNAADAFAAAASQGRKAGPMGAAAAAAGRYQTKIWL